MADQHDDHDHDDHDHDAHDHDAHDAHDHGGKGGHGHHHGLRAGARFEGRLRIAVVLLVLLLVGQTTAALITRSLALLSDSGHVLTDVLGLTMSIGAIRIANKGDHAAHRTYGLYRLEILAALANAALLLGVGVYVVYEAIGRFRDPHELDGGAVLIAALAGLAVNVVAFLLLREGAEESLNVRGAYLEVLADMLGSVGVVASAIVMITTGWSYIDPIAAIAIGVWIVPRTLRLGAEAVRVLVEAAPAGVDLDRLEADLNAIDGVIDVHDLHVWTLTSQMDMASAHLMVSDGTDHHAVLDQARHLLRTTHRIDHATLQIEPHDHRGCDEVKW